MSFRPFSDPPPSLRDVQEEIGRVVERMWRGAVPPGAFSPWSKMPPIDVYEFDNRYVISVEVPGLSSEDVQVTYLGNALTVKGEKPAPVEESTDVTIVRHERRFGKFSRTVELPEAVDADRISAKCQAGLLEITVPKKGGAAGKSVKVTEA